MATLEINCKVKNLDTVKTVTETISPLEKLDNVEIKVERNSHFMNYTIKVYSPIEISESKEKAPEGSKAKFLEPLMNAHGFEYDRTEQPYTFFMKNGISVGLCYGCGIINNNGAKVAWRDRSIENLQTILETYK